jgi:hypothetical protein
VCSCTKGFPSYFDGIQAIDYLANAKVREFKKLLEQHVGAPLQIPSPGANYNILHPKLALNDQRIFSKFVA